MTCIQVMSSYERKCGMLASSMTQHDTNWSHLGESQWGKWPDQISLWVRCLD